MSKESLSRPRLPVQQLVILSICRFAEPLALTSVFPYLPEMMEYLNVKTDDVAFYAGLVSAVFSLGQSLTGLLWGRASDAYGRKPTILLGLACMLVSSILFGFSQSVTWALVSRGVAGLSSGNVGILRTVVAEMVPEKELQPLAFSIMPLIWSVGSIFGPALGGALTMPTKAHPHQAVDGGFVARFPYALPNLVVSAFFCVGILTGFLFLKETLETRRHSRDHGLLLGKALVGGFSVNPSRWTSSRRPDEERDLLAGYPDRAFGSLDADRDLSADGERQPLPDDGHDGPGKQGNGVRDAPAIKIRDVLSPQSTINLAAYTFLALHTVAVNQLLSVFLHHPRQPHIDNPDGSLPLRFAGGFGLHSQSIGLLFTLCGVCSMFAQFLIFPPCARRYGALGCFKATAIICPLVYVVTPFTALVEDDGARQALIFVLMLIRSIAIIFAFPSSTILLTNSASSIGVLATLNGVATSFSALGRAIGPAVAGATFTVGVRLGYVILPWWIIAALSSVGAVPIWYLVEDDGPADRHRHPYHPQHRTDTNVDANDDEHDPPDAGNGYSRLESDVGDPAQCPRAVGS